MLKAQCSMQNAQRTSTIERSTNNVEHWAWRIEHRALSSIEHLLGGTFERDEAKQASAAAVPQLMTADADRRSDLEHVLLPATAFDLDHAGALEGPQRRLALVVFDFDVDPGVRVDPVH